MLPAWFFLLLLVSWCFFNCLLLDVLLLLQLQDRGIAYYIFNSVYFDVIMCCPPGLMDVHLLEDQ